MRLPRHYGEYLTLLGQECHGDSLLVLPLLSTKQGLANEALLKASDGDVVSCARKPTAVGARCESLSIEHQQWANVLAESRLACFRDLEAQLLKGQCRRRPWPSPIHETADAGAEER